MSGNTAAMAALAPGPVLVLDRDLVHALAAEAGTTSSNAPQRYLSACVCMCVCVFFSLSAA